MNTPQIPKTSRFSWFTARGIACSLVLCAAAAYAAAGAKPILLVDIKDAPYDADGDGQADFSSKGSGDGKGDSKGGNSNKGGSNDKGGGKDKGGDKGGGNSSTTNSNQIVYTFTVTNAGKEAVSGVTAEYHVYVYHQTGGKGITVDDVQGSETFDLAAGSKKVLKSSPIDHSVTTTVSGASAGAGGKKPKAMSSGSQNTSSVGPKGAYVVLKVGDNKVGEKEDPINAKKNAEKIIAAQEK